MDKLTLPLTEANEQIAGTLLPGAGCSFESAVTGTADQTQLSNATSAIVSPEFNIVEINRKLIGASFFLFEIGYTDTGEAIISFTGQLYKDAILKKLNEMGYYKRLASQNTFNIVREHANVLSSETPATLKDDFFFNILPECKLPLVVQYKGAVAIVTIENQRESFLSQSYSLFNTTFLEHLVTLTKPVLRDNRNTTHFCFQNKIVIVSATDNQVIDYQQLDNVCVWKDQIIQRDFTSTTDFMNGHFARFIKNVAGNNELKQSAFYSAVGYMLNNYNDPSRGQAVVCYDEKPSKVGEPGGGTGKGLFSNGIKQLRNVLKVDGKKIRKDDRFRFQGVTLSTQVFWLDDVHQDFPFEVLHSVSTDGWSIEKKFKDEFFIPAMDGPKIILCSNIILSGGGSTNKRRQFILEFSDHYSRNIISGAEEPIKDEHGCIFFDNDYWDANEWAKFDSFMLWCAEYYLRNGLMPYTKVGQECSRLIQLTDEDFAEWVVERFTIPGEEYDSRQQYDEFIRYIGENESLLKPRQFNHWLLIYAKTKNWSLKTRKSNGRKHFRFIPIEC